MKQYCEDHRPRLWRFGSYDGPLNIKTAPDVKAISDNFELFLIFLSFWPTAKMNDAQFKRVMAEVFKACFYANTLGWPQDFS